VYIETFDAVWWGLLAGIAALSLLVWLFLRNRSVTVRTRALIAICAFNFLFFWLYKYWLSQDAVYLAENAYKGFEIWLELPLQLCNINLLLIPLALVVRRRSLLAFCFYSAVLGALAAISSPPVSFSGDLLQPHNIGFYGTHALLIVCGVSLATLGFIKPRQRDVFWTVLIMLIVTCAIHGVNTLIRHALHVNANYFYTYGADGSLILSDVYALLPLPLVYLFLLIVVIVPALMLLTALINLPPWLRGRKRRRKGGAHDR
jgi:uncharacterized membrane protein YwaF